MRDNDFLQGMCKWHTSPSHHFDKIAHAKLVAHAPANTHKDDLAIKVAHIEQLVKVLQLTHHRSTVRDADGFDPFTVPFCTGTDDSPTESLILQRNVLNPLKSHQLVGKHR